MKFNREIFFDAYRRKFGAHLSKAQVQGFETLLTSMEDDPNVQRVDWMAYMLATVYHETARRMQPIHEFGGRSYFIKRYGSQTKVGKSLGNDTPEEGAIYAGRGYVQLTGEDNYERMEEALRREYPQLVAEFERETGRTFDLTVGDQTGDAKDPDNAMNPKIAYAIMSYGMRHGSFTGKKFSDFFYGARQDWVNARRIINRLDRASKIASYAVSFETILKEAEEVEVEIVPPKGEISVNPVTLTDTVVVDAPPATNTTSTATKATIAGVTVPAFVAVAVKSVTDLVSQGYISAQEIGSFTLKLVSDNQKYVLWLVLGLMALLGIKRTLGQVGLWIKMWIAGDKSKNNVEVQPK